MRAFGALIVAASFALAAPAWATADAPAAGAQPPTIRVLPAPELRDVLVGAGLGESKVPLAAIDVRLLAHVLAGLPGLRDLHEVEGLEGQEGVEKTLERAIKMMIAGTEAKDPPEAFEELVGEFGLTFWIEKSLESTFQHSPGTKKAEVAEQAIEEQLGRREETIVIEGLNSLTPAELLGTLLAGGAHPETLAGALFAAADQPSLEQALGTAPGSAAFVSSTLTALAQSLEREPSTLIEALGLAGLSPSSPVLERELPDGQKLALFASPSGVAFLLIGDAPAPPPAPPAPAPLAPAPAPSEHQVVATSSADIPVRIVGHHLKGSVFTVILQVPAAGRLTLHSSGLRDARRTVRHSGRIAVRMDVSPRTEAMLRRRHALMLRIRATFTTKAGKRSSARVALLVR
jgi:hypothetical protein